MSRYYKAPMVGETKRIVEEVLDQNQRFTDYVRAFMQEIGASECLPDAERGLIRGFLFPGGIDKCPSHLTWKKEGRGWTPKRNTIEGKKLAKRMQSLPIVDYSLLWKHVGWEGHILDEQSGTIHFHPAFKLSSDDQLALFWTDEKGEWVPPDFLEPISWEEWKELSGGEDESKS